MNGILVGMQSDNYIYFVIDQNIQSDQTGAVIKPDGVTYLVPFWDWVNSRGDVTEILDNEFQQNLWGESENRDKNLWKDVFVDRLVPITQEILGDVEMVPLKTNQNPLKKQSDTMNTQTKVAKLMLLMSKDL